MKKISFMAQRVKRTFCGVVVSICFVNCATHEIPVE